MIRRTRLVVAHDVYGWHWTLFTRAGEPVAEAVVYYDSKPKAVNAAKRLAVLAAQAWLEVEDA